MQEVLVKTHLIITDIHEEYDMNWCGKIIDADPVFENGKPVFVIIGSTGRMELNTIDMKLLEDNAKRMTYPRGRAAIIKDMARIYIKQIDGSEKLLGILTHKHVKTFAPMFDRIGYR